MAIVNMGRVWCLHSFQAKAPAPNTTDIMKLSFPHIGMRGQSICQPLSMVSAKALLLPDRAHSGLSTVDGGKPLLNGGRHALHQVLLLPEMSGTVNLKEVEL
jgi:hypothetical protein